MTTRVRLIAVLALIALAGVALERVGEQMLARDRREMYRAFADDRTHRLEAAALELGNDVEKIGQDLELAAVLAARSESPATFERELNGIATITREYAAIEVRSDAGTIAQVVAADSPSQTVLRDAADEIDAVIAAARAEPDTLETSRPLGGADEPLAWLRVFAQAHAGVVVAIVVDMRPLLTKLRLLADDTSELLVIGAHGTPAPASDPALAEAVRTLPASRAQMPAMARLLEAIEARRPASVVLGEDEARRVGLAPAAAVAVAVPVVIEDGEPWALALVSSTSALKSQERRLVRRVLLGGGIAIALLVALSAYFVRNARRAATLQERLAQAGRLANLTEKVLHSEKLATAGQLAAGIAHEIGTPLNIARGRAELAVARLGDDHPQAPGQRIIVDQIDHVSRLITQLLDYVRPRAPVVEPVDAAGAIAATIELLAPEAAKRRVRVASEIAPGTSTVRADPGQLRQVLVNLAMNALDACPAGGHVVLRARPDGAAVVIEVEDDGAGIAEEHRAQVFDPFFTSKKRGQGTGLGLWVVMQLVRSHGAELELISAKGAGTIVRLVWPS